MKLCKTCELTGLRDKGTAPLWDSIHRTDYWDVAHAYNTSLPGWLVLIHRQHIEALSDMTEQAAVELGPLLHRVSQVLKEVTGCVKTYVIQFAEHEDHPHVHFHIVPRLADQPEDHRSMGIFKYLEVPDTECMSEEEMNALAIRIRWLLED